MEAKFMSPGHMLYTNKRAFDNMAGNMANFAVEPTWMNLTCLMGTPSAIASVKKISESVERIGLKGIIHCPLLDYLLASLLRSLSSECDLEDMHRVSSTTINRNSSRLSIRSNGLYASSSAIRPEPVVAFCA